MQRLLIHLRVLFWVLGLSLACASLLRAAPTLVHQPPLAAVAGQPVPVNVTVTDPASRIVQVTLYYRTAGALGYQQELMSGAGYNYSARIPGNAVTAAGVEYYLEARNTAGEKATAPPLNAATAPYHLVAREAAGAPALRLVYPAAESVISPEAGAVVVAVDAGRSRPDPSSLSVTFDGAVVTGRCQVSETLISFALPVNLASGRHEVGVKLKNLDGAEARASWFFSVSREAGPEFAAQPQAEERAAAVRLAGGLTAEIQYAALTRKPADTAYLAQPESWLNRLNFNLDGKLLGLNLLGSVYLTSEDQPGRQPVDRLRLELFDDSFNLTVGDMYPLFSDYSLYNLFVRGAGVALTSGPRDLSFSEFRVLGGLTQVPIEGRDASSPGTFEQWLWATRWVYHFLPGTGLALNFSSVNDYPHSITNNGGNFPANNHVATAEANIKIPWAPEVSTSLFGEYGFSYYDETQTLLSISLADAYRGGMRWDWGGRSYLQLQYKNTGANFVSLASPWLIGDWRGLAGDAQIFLFEDKLAISASGEAWHDNLDGQKTQTYIDAAGVSVTAGTTTTTRLSGQLNYRLSDYVPSVSVGYSLNRQQDDTTPSPIVDNQTHVLSLGAGGQIPVGPDQLLANLSYSQTDFADLATPRLSADMSSSSFILSLMYLLGREWSFSAGYGLTGNWIKASGLAPAAGGTTAGTQDQKLDYVLANLRAAWKALPGKLDLGAGLELLNGKDNLRLVENGLTTLSVDGTYYFTSGHSLGLKVASIDYADRLQSANSYGEFVVTLRYGLNF